MAKQWETLWETLSGPQSVSRWVLLKVLLLGLLWALPMGWQLARQ